MNLAQRLRLTCSLGLILLVISACDSGLETAPQPDQSAWHLVNPRPFDVKIDDMWGTSAGRVMAVGRDGAVMTREGNRWREAPRPTRTDIFDVQGCDWQHIWAVCYEGLLFFDGSRWDLRWPGTHSRQDRVYCRAPGDVMLVTSEGESFHFDGQTWTRQQLPFEPNSGADDWLLGWSGGYTVIGQAGQSATWQNGQWGPVEVIEATAYLTHLIPYSRPTRLGNEIVPLAVGKHAGEDQIYFYRRYGFDDWNWPDVWPLDGRLLAVATARRTHGFFVASRPSNLNMVRIQSSDNWLETIDFPGLSEAVLQVFNNPFDFRDNTAHFVLAGSYSTFYVGTDEAGIEQSTGGLPFATRTLYVWPNGDFSGLDAWTGFIHGRSGRVTIQADSLASQARALWGPDPTTIYTVGGDGIILQLGPNEPAVQMPAPTTDYLRDIWGSGPDRIFAGGNTDFLSFDGNTWSAIATPTDFVCEQLAGTAGGDVFVMARLLLWRWDGTTWTEVAAAGDNEYFRELSVAPGGNKVFLLTDVFTAEGYISNIRVWADSTWTKLDAVPQNTYNVIALSDNTLLARGRDGLFIRRGGTWQPLPMPNDTRIESVSADPTGGIYTIDYNNTIRYFDLGGTGLWQ